MDFPERHLWGLSPAEAVALQKSLAPEVVLENRVSDTVETVAGADVSYGKGGGIFYAAVVVLSFPAFEIVDEAWAVGRVDFPYVPGLLSFRELPLLLDAFHSLRSVPHVVLVDGQGIAHPRRFGLASHLGIWLGLPTIGCAKSRLIGEYDEPGLEKGERTPLYYGDDVVGTVLRSRRGVKPLYVSPGHLVDVERAADLAFACCGRYRMPEPTRRAHLLSNKLRLAAKS